MNKYKMDYYVSEANESCYTFLTDNEFGYHIWDNTTTVRHKHGNYIEIFVILRGEMTNTMLGETTTLGPGNIGIILPGIPHMHSKINDGEVEILNSTCKLETAVSIFSNIYHRNIPKSSIQKLNKTEFSIVKNFNNMILHSNTSSDYNVLISSLCITLLGFCKTTAQKISEGPLHFIEFVNSLPTYDLANLKINELYKYSGYSQRSLSLFFKKYLNKTLVQYVNDIKLNKAKNLLISTDYPITHICMQVGFDSISHFNHLFKNKYGLSPKEYRQMQC